MSRHIEEQRVKLVEFAAQLRRLTFPSSPLSIDLVKYVATAIESYCSGKAKTMDAALDLIRGKGAPGNPAQREKIARKIYPMRKVGMSWNNIKKDGRELFDVNTETVVLRRDLREFEGKIQLDSLSDELVEQLKKEGWLQVT